MKSYKAYLISSVAVAIIAAGALFFFTIGELEKPGIQFSQDVSAIGHNKIIEINLSDEKRGLRSVTVAITQNNKTSIISSADFPQSGTKKKLLPVTIDATGLKLVEGPATLTVSATDYSIWKNQTVVSRQVTIDLMPPQITLLFNLTNNINPGGTGLVLYRTSKPTPVSGVQAENRFYPGYATTISGKPCTVAYFPLSMQARNGHTAIRVMARDAAGNTSSVAIPALILDKKFRKDSVNLSDTFLQKISEFQQIDPELRGKQPVDVFMAVNTKMRDDNFKTIQSVCQKSEPRQLWEGTFLRMKNASPMAMYGDSRTYMYNGKSIGESIHMGVDLASTAHAGIEASNHGTVVFTGPLGIYGNAVIIDHGFGIFSLYAHLSSIGTKTGQSVKKGDILGQSGMTGLAGGDHLHFSIIVGGEFVNPVEWWDPHWIADNVNKKLATAN
jgi:murein DD-endopeptidase MepM/ murein hydrolase activator NlpD